MRDVKRRDTAHYLFACAGSRQLSLWQLDPFAGEMQATKLQAEGRGAAVRDFTCLAFRCAVSFSSLSVCVCVGGLNVGL